MASARLEFLDDEQELMREIYAFLEQKLGPKKPKPPIKNAAGKWHVYLENPAHKRGAKAMKKKTLQCCK